MAGHYTAVTGHSADLRSIIKRCLTQAPDRRPNAGAATCRGSPLKLNFDHSARAYMDTFNKLEHSSFKKALRHQTLVTWFTCAVAMAEHTQ